MGNGRICVIPIGRDLPASQANELVADFLTLSGFSAFFGGSPKLLLYRLANVKGAIFGGAFPGAWNVKELPSAHCGETPVAWRVKMKTILLYEDELLVMKLLRKY